MLNRLATWYRKKQPYIVVFLLVGLSLPYFLIVSFIAGVKTAYCSIKKILKNGKSKRKKAGNAA